MLQPRLENEQFNSLPNLLTSERSRTGFITTDRPDSSQLVDLHVYIIPKKVWRDVQHLAENEAMDEATSAGFVHVSPNMKICDLRQSIEQLCGTESFFPRDFIFLRSVGRCLTRVKPRQEKELKVKNYRPPQTFAPEIYLLEGRHEDYAHIPCASPALSSSSYMFGNRNRSDHDDDRLSPTRLTQSVHRRPMRGGKHYLPAVNVRDSLSQYPSSGRQSWSKFTQIGSDPEESSTKELSKLKEEQERLRRRQAELERMRRAAEEKKVQSEREEDERRRQQQALTEQEDEERRQQQALTEQEDEERRQRQEKTDAERRRLEQEKADAARRRLEQEKAEAARRRIEQEAAATKIQASYRGFKDRQVFRERKRSVLNDDARMLSSKPHASKKETVEPHEEEEEEIHIHHYNTYDDLSDGVNRKRSSAKSSKSIDNNNEHEDTQHEIELEDQRRRELAKRQREDPETLRARLQELRARRIDLEKLREEVIKHLKNIHNRITLRRKEARDMWKKKYFVEKKKTPTLEEHVLLLKTELDQIHKRTIQTIDGEAKHATQVGYTKEADVGNLIVQVTRTHHDIQDIRHQVEQAKLRLTTDVKLRNQAENECRSLRHELNQAKMNLNHIKTHV
ncbi:unnamed protein product [Rotaria magnacalcarata]|uniref:Spermatogenesis-associated protein 1 C-terminal domain-containing protein n=1 Tax=Rotaria magnacalcarata TaxID=392030 RepID=A0A8S2KGT7_9BILA|nr:unnamed protein product [Rotaria magnacalcarata]